MFSLLSFIIDHWQIWAGLFLVGVLASFFLAPAIGRKLIVPAVVSALALLAYWSGKRTERRQYEERAKKIQTKREQAYDEIDRRGTDADDVADRLWDGNF